ncbi:MAG TPA: hypothetical protein VJY99_14725 [Buttiauxella sp.]|uniref:hypothetical protein n=1 Tax=Buttiauxella sp. TaxID=1972222 RepID=UPI002B4806B0|nr:hypothetical protein [Buttiauxella sp.]HKM97930.1 hypothetical protein [Buttiauxella sp.]
MLNLFTNFLSQAILFTFLIFPLLSIAGDLTIVKYGYGLKGRGEIKYEDIVVHPIYFTKNPYYPSSFQVDNNRKFNTSIKLAIQRKGKESWATVTIKNLGAKSFYIRGLEFPSIPPNQIKNKNLTFMLCGRNFIITTGNILLDYLGGVCDYRGDFVKSEWTKFAPNVSLSYTVILNDNSKFFSDKTRYNIGTTEYGLVNDDWFIERSIFDYFFSILDMNPSNCHISDGKRYIFPEDRICNYYFYDKKDIKYIFDQFNFTGVNKENEFSIRSNLVSVEIDGSNAKSFYDKP